MTITNMNKMIITLLIQRIQDQMDINIIHLIKLSERSQRWLMFVQDVWKDKTNLYKSVKNLSYPDICACFNIYCKSLKKYDFAHILMCLHKFPVEVQETAWTN